MESLRQTLERCLIQKRPKHTLIAAFKLVCESVVDWSEGCLEMVLKFDEQFQFATFLKDVFTSKVSKLAKQLVMDEFKESLSLKVRRDDEELRKFCVYLTDLFEVAVAFKNEEVVDVMNDGKGKVKLHFMVMVCPPRNIDEALKQRETTNKLAIRDVLGDIDEDCAAKAVIEHFLVTDHGE